MRVVTAAFAIAAGFIVLLGYFFPAQLGSLRLLLLDWGIIIAGMAVLVGILIWLLCKWKNSVPVKKAARMAFCWSYRSLSRLGLG